MPAAKYRQIADDLRDQITAGNLPPGSQLPTEPKLAASYGASRSTVRLAIGLLIQQGLVETRQGIGTYVTQPPTPLTVVLSREEDWRAGETADAALQPTGEPATRPTTARFQAETTTADAETAAALKIAEGTPVVLRRTQRYLDKDPWSLVVSCYPAGIVKGTALEQAAPSASSASLVLAEHGHQPATGTRSTPGCPTPPKPPSSSCPARSPSPSSAAPPTTPPSPSASPATSTAPTGSACATKWATSRPASPKMRLRSPGRGCWERSGDYAGNGRSAKDSRASSSKMRSAL